MAMSTPDMEVIKEIPGYKVILKAVLKSQIQQLVEQLAKTTDEESVILTASVADGTLCHLGSDSGKIFLEDHEDIKSQFLGFCLKRHHAEKLEQERKAAQEREDALSRSMQSEPSPHFISIPPFNPTQYQPPRRNSPRIRSPSNRHQPYPIRGPIPVQQQIKSNTVQGPVSSTRTSTEGPVIKTEPFSDNENSISQAGSVSNSTISSEPASTFNSTISSPDSKRENCLSSTVDPSVIDNSINIGLDPNVSVKLESGTNDEELEITGVELGQGPTVSKQDWTLNLQAGGPGATRTSAEMNPDQQGFITIDMLQEITKDNINDEIDTDKLPLVLPYSVDEMLEKSMIRGKPTSAQIYFRKLLRDAAISANIWKTAPTLSEISDSKRIAFFNAFEMIPGLNERKKDIWKRLGESLQNRRKYLNDKTKGKRFSREESSD